MRPSARRLWKTASPSRQCEKRNVSSASSRTGARTTCSGPRRRSAAQRVPGGRDAPLPPWRVGVQARTHRGDGVLERLAAHEDFVEGDRRAVGVEVPAVHVQPRVLHAPAPLRPPRRAVTPLLQRRRAGPGRQRVGGSAGEGGGAVDTCPHSAVLPGVLPVCTASDFASSSLMASSTWMVRTCAGSRRLLAAFERFTCVVHLTKQRLALQGRGPIRRGCGSATAGKAVCLGLLRRPGGDSLGSVGVRDASAIMRKDAQVGFGNTRYGHLPARCCLPRCVPLP